MEEKYMKKVCIILLVLILSLSMGTSVWSLVTFVKMPSGGALAAGLGTGILFYFIMAKVFKFNEFTELMALIRKK